VFYGNILASAYTEYAKYKNETPYVKSVLFVVASQMVQIFFAFTLIKSLLGIDLVAFLIPSKYFVILYLCIGGFLAFKYFNRSRVQKLVDNFGKKSDNQRKLWGLIAICGFILPTIFMAIILTK
jgi:hypothetical protein